MALAWGERKRLMRLTALADELLTATRIPRDPGGHEALGSELDSVVGEVRELLGDADARLAGEFDRVVARADEPRPPDVRAAALAGWLRGVIAVESLDEARAQHEEQQGSFRRKLTIGFGGRSRTTAPPPSSGRDA
jgi:hypothetical protein